MMATFSADEDALNTLSDDVGGLWCRPIAVLEYPPDSFKFLRGTRRDVPFLSIMISIMMRL
jgi:hypothetical protein